MKRIKDRLSRTLAMLLAVLMIVGTLPVTAFAEEGAEPTEICAAEGCEYAANHEGNCSNYVAPTVCETEGCTYAYGHEGDCSPVVDQTAAQNVIDLIAAIGEVTLESEAAISAADTAYAALTDGQKAPVTNYDVLETARAAYMQLSAVPVPVEDSVTIETGHVAEFITELYLSKIVMQGVSGTVSGSEMNWEIELAEDTDMTQPITFELTGSVAANRKASCYFWVDGTRSEKSIADADPGTFTVLPAWNNGRATVTACVGTASKANGTLYTIEMSIKGLAKEDFNTVKLNEEKVKKYFVSKIALSNAMATAFTVSDTDFSGSTSGHRATVEYTLDSMPAKPVTLTFTMATTGGCYIACNGADRVEASDTYTTEVDLGKGMAHVFKTYSTKSNSTIRGTYTIKFTVDGLDTNTAPTLSDSSVSGEKGSFNTGESYSLDLATIFRDAEMDGLTYTVQINDAEPVAAAEKYTLPLDKAGEYTLVFRASDGKLTSEECYTAELTVKENTAPALTGEAAGSQTIDQYTTFSLDLSKIFTDADGNDLTYTVSVNDGEAKTATANYSYTAETADTVVFVFRAKDHALTSPEYTFTLKVNRVAKTTISTNCSGTHGFDSWLGTIAITGAEITSWEWSVEAGHDETEAHVLSIQLDGTTPDDAVLQLAYTEQRATSTVGGSINGPASVTLADGKGSVTVTSSPSLNSWGKVRTYVLNFTNQVNSAPTASATSTATLYTGDTFTLDLSKVFTDADGEALTYTVTSQGKTADTGSSFSRIISTGGEHVFAFTATDPWGAIATHTVTVTATQNNNTYEVTVKMPEGITPGFYITNGSDGENGDTYGDALTAAAGTSANGFVAYTVKVPENVGCISFRGTDAAGNNWGGMTAEVSKDMEPITVVKVLGVIRSKVNNVYATAEQALFQLKDKDGFYAVSGSTTTDSYGITNYRFLVVAFGTDDLAMAYTAYVVPQGELTTNYTTSVGLNKTFTKDEPQQITQLGLTLKSGFTVTVPEGATVQAFQWKQYYKADEIPASDTVENADGTVSWMFVKSDAYRMTYRASMEGKLTKVGYVNGDEVTITWDETDASPDCRTPYDTSTLYGSRGDDSIVVNVNAQNNLRLENGGTFRLRGYRIWEVVNSDTQNVMIQPDMHYTLTGDDIVTVTPVTSGNGNGKNNWLDLQATGNGVAYLELSYDAMQVVTGNQSSFGGEELAGFVFNACDPARTALVVVQVGNAATDVSFGIQCSSVLGSSAVPWDAEFDTLYFIGDSGELKLSPAVTSGTIAKVEVSRDKGNFWTELTAVDGVYTAPIVSGNNVIRVTKGDGTQAYQVVRGDKVSYTMTEKQGDGDGVPESGETYRVQLSGLHNPIGKMSGNYNPGYQAGQHVYYKFNGSTVYTTENYQYDFVSNAWVDVTIPGNTQIGDVFTLSNGYIGFNVVGITDFLNDQENHRGITDDGHMTRGSSGTGHQRSILPEITLTVRDSEAEVRNVLTLIDAIETATDKTAAVEAARAAYTSLTDAQKQKITNYEKLTAAEKALADAADAAAARAVETLIDVIKDVTLDDEAAITKARAAYTALTAAQQKLVDPNYLQILEKAEAEIVVLKDKKAAADVDEKILAIGEVTLEKEDQIKEATASYMALTTAQKKYVTKLSVLKEADQQLQTLKNPESVDFGLDPSEIVGYVTVSFEDYGIRVEGEKVDSAYASARGVIVPATKVPFCAYDTIASVTIRLLTAKGITASYLGTEFSGFYLSAVGDLAEFSAGSGSGWMITWNDWFINKGASEFTVKDGDVVKWQYTCQLGADIGDDSFYGAAIEVINLINAIGVVTAESGDEIMAAREAYDKLSDTDKKRVNNYQKLLDAEEAVKRLTTDADKAAADAVEALIDAIGTVTKGKKDEIEAAREAYNKLTDLQKLLVENEDTLRIAESILETLLTASTEDVYKATGDYLEDLAEKYVLTVASEGGEWIVVGLERSGRDTPNVSAYYRNVVQYVEKEINNKEQLHSTKSTDNSRVILGLTAAGYDVTNVGGHNLLKGLTDMSYVKKQGINGPIWALIAFDSHDYEIPAGGDVTREKLIDYILSKQLEDGGWALSGTAADADMTGMALTALAPYCKEDAKVKAAVDTALTTLSKMQEKDGSFGSTDGACAESCAQVIVALAALGIDPETDERFVKNGISVVDALRTFYVEGGGFKHVSDGSRNGMATEQSYYALAAYFRFLDAKKTSLFDMTDVKIKTAVKVVEDLIDAIGEVTYDTECKGRIDAARTAYDALSSADKAKVTNYKKLTKAEAEYTQLEKNYKAVQRVIDLIDSIGYVTLSSENKILRARAAYNSLTYAQKKLVYNYSTLLYAEERLEELKIERVEDLIAAIGTVTLDSKAKIEAARAAYEALDSASQKKVSNLSVLVAAEKAYEKLVEEAKEEEIAKRVNKVSQQIDSIDEEAAVEEILDAIAAFDALTEDEKVASGKADAVEALKKQVAEMIQTDTETGIAVSDVEWNIQLVVEKEQSAAQTEALQEKLGDNTLLGMWDIYLKDILTDGEIQPDGTVLVKIPLALLDDYSAFDGLAVVHYADDGAVEFLNCEIANDYVAFHAADFSYYAVVGYMGDSPLESMMSDDASVTPWIIVACCAVVLLGAVLYLNGKSKKQKTGKHVG